MCSVRAVYKVKTNLEFESHHESDNRKNYNYESFILYISGKQKVKMERVELTSERE